MTTVKQLKKQFDGRGEVRGYKFTQIKSSNTAFMYEITNGDSTYYEVFEKRVNALYGNVSYPSSKSFGKWAWCFLSKQKAEEKFLNINNKKW